MQPVLLFAVAACVAALPAAPPQAGARSLTAKAHEHAMVTIPTDEQAFAEYAEAVLQTMPAKVRHVLLTHFAACLDHHVALKGLDTTAATPSEHDAEALVSSAHDCLRHARVNTPLIFKAALDAIVAFDRAGAVATGRQLKQAYTPTIEVGVVDVYSVYMIFYSSARIRVEVLGLYGLIIAVIIGNAVKPQ